MNTYNTHEKTLIEGILHPLLNASKGVRYTYHKIYKRNVITISLFEEKTILVFISPKKGTCKSDRSMQGNLLKEVSFVRCGEQGDWALLEKTCSCDPVAILEPGDLPDGWLDNYRIGYIYPFKKGEFGKL